MEDQISVVSQFESGGGLNYIEHNRDHIAYVEFYVYYVLSRVRHGTSCGSMMRNGIEVKFDDTNAIQSLKTTMEAT